jgi:hypothetical protein
MDSEYVHSEFDHRINNHCRKYFDEVGRLVQHIVIALSQDVFDLVLKYGKELVLLQGSHKVYNNLLMMHMNNLPLQDRGEWKLKFIMYRYCNKV